MHTKENLHETKQSYVASPHSYHNKSSHLHVPYILCIYITQPFLFLHIYRQPSPTSCFKSIKGAILNFWLWFPLRTPPGINHIYNS